jgi:hypothetical protein
MTVRGPAGSIVRTPERQSLSVLSRLQSGRLQVRDDNHQSSQRLHSHCLLDGREQFGDFLADTPFANGR